MVTVANDRNLRFKPMNNGKGLNVLLCLGYDTFIFSRRDILERPLKVSLGSIQRSAFLVGLKVGVDELDQSIEILGRDLIMSVRKFYPYSGVPTVSFC